MADSVAGVVLAAGAGTRLRPLSDLRPKPLCPVGPQPLVDHGLGRLVPVSGRVAVNVHHGRDRMERHLTGRAHLSVEGEEALGTAGALGHLRDWLDGSAVLVTNADTWLPVDLAGFVDGWDGERVRLLVVRDPLRGDFGPLRYCGVALHPWSAVRDLAAVPSGLYEVCWRHRWADGTLDLVTHDGPFVDCGTPADYLAANLLHSGGAAVLGDGAKVAGDARVERSVVWPGAEVGPGELLVDAVRADAGVTVLVR